MFIPAAYHKNFGPQLWELNQRSRAVDNQLFVAAISPARKENVKYVVYGYSLVVDPFGQVLTKADIGEEIVFWEIGEIR